MLRHAWNFELSGGGPRHFLVVLFWIRWKCMLPGHAFGSGFIFAHTTFCQKGNGEYLWLSVAFVKGWIKSEFPKGTTGLKTTQILHKNKAFTISKTGMESRRCCGSRNLKRPVSRNQWWSAWRETSQSLQLTSTRARALTNLTNCHRYGQGIPIL